MLSLSSILHQSKISPLAAEYECSQLSLLIMAPVQRDNPQNRPYFSPLVAQFEFLDPQVVPHTKEVLHMGFLHPERDPGGSACPEKDPEVLKRVPTPSGISGRPLGVPHAQREIQGVRGGCLRPARAPGSPCGPQAASHPQQEIQSAHTTNSNPRPAAPPPKHSASHDRKS